MGRKLTRADLAEVFDCAKTTVDVWVNEGCPYDVRGTKGAAWQFDSADVHRWLVARATKEKRRRGNRFGGNPEGEEAGEGEMSLGEAQRRKAVADAKKSELGLANDLGLVAPVDRLLKAVSDEVAKARARLLAIPSKFLPTLQMIARDEDGAKRGVKVLDDAIHEALSEIKAGA